MQLCKFFIFFKNLFKKHLVLSLSISYFIVYLILNIYTPFKGDDYAYSFNYATSDRISSFYDIYESQLFHYCNVNGRLIPHILEQLFCGILGKGIFNIFNAFMCVLLIYLISRIIERMTDAFQIRVLILNTTFLASLLLFSYPGQCMFWMAGALNYLWPTVFALILIEIFLRNYKLNLILLFLFALISGWCQEAVSIPLSLCLSYWVLFNKKYRTSTNITLLIAYIIGTLLIILSPGTLSRFIEGNEIQFLGNVLRVLGIKLVMTLKLFGNQIIYWICFFVILFTIKRKHVVFSSLHYMVLWIFNSIFFVCLGFGHERVTFLLSVVSYIIVSNFILTLVLKKNYRVNFLLLRRISFLFVVCCSIYSIFICKSFYERHNKIIQYISLSSDECVILPYEKFKYPSRLIYDQEISSDINTLNPNKVLAFYYHKKMIQAIDMHILQDIKQGNLIGNNESTFASKKGWTMHYDKKSQFYYIIFPVNYLYTNFRIVSVNKMGDTSLPFYKKIVRGILGTSKSHESPLDFYKLYKEENCLCIIPKVTNEIELIRIIDNNNSELIDEYSIK